MLVIGIAGRAGSGKSLIAEHLIGRHGFERRKFATALKQMTRTFLRYAGVVEPLIERMIEGDLKDRPTAFLNGRSPRDAMIALGHDWGRERMDRNLWVDAEFRAIGRDRPAAIVFDDVRYPNEVDTIYRLGGVLWRVERPGQSLASGYASHESESLDVVPNLKLVNDSSPGMLRVEVDMAVAALKRAAEIRAARAA